jgi:hypothetical protein
VEPTTAKRIEPPVPVEIDALESLIGLDPAAPSYISPRQKTEPPDGNDLAQIENALDVLLTKLLEERERKRRAPGPKPPLRAFSAAELAEMPILSDQEIMRERIIEDPVGGAFEYAIRELGEVLFERGDVELMRELLERVASRHPKSYGQRATILDHKWDGIGNRWFC